MHLCCSLKTFVFVHNFFTNQSQCSGVFSFPHSYCASRRHFYTIIINQGFFPNDNFLSKKFHHHVFQFRIAYLLLHNSMFINIEFQLAGHPSVTLYGEVVLQSHSESSPQLSCLIWYHQEAIFSSFSTSFRTMLNSTRLNSMTSLAFPSLL